MKKIAVILSGCGVLDGSEIHESVCALLAIKKQGAEYHCLAPNMNQHQVINHLTQEPMAESRNVLVEAARIARGHIVNIAEANVADYDAAIYPGGFGAAINASNFAEKGEACVVQEDILKFAQAMAEAGKPQGFICIAPTLISKIYGPGVQHTIGNDASVSEKIRAMGGAHVESDVMHAVVDKTHKVVSTPAYMLANDIAEVEAGVSELVKNTLSLA